MEERAVTQYLETDDVADDDWGRTLPHEADDDLVGMTLNATYFVERILGEGGMGRVYLARHARILQKRVAIKVLHSEHNRNPEVVARFHREAEAAASISHPNVLSVYDVDRTPQGRVYIVYEYLEGMELAEHLKNRKKLDVAQALHIIRQVCHGLAAAHSRGVIHRDLKPQNIFLVGDFRDGVPARPHVKILDFGLSRFIEPLEGVELTKVGAVMGTPAYMPPEQALGLRADQRADVYGVGAVLYKLLTGRPPFHEPSAQATVLAVVSSEPARPRALEPSIPEDLERVIECALSRDPANRYGDMWELERALSALEPENIQTVPSFTARAVLLPEPPPAIIPANPSLPRIHLDSEPVEEKLERPRVLRGILLAGMWLAVILAVVVTGLEQVTRRHLGRVELGFMLAVLFMLTMPLAVFWVARIRRRMWDHLQEVHDLLSDVRLALYATLMGCGAAWVLLQLVDVVLLRLFRSPPIPRLEIAWLGWNLAFPAMGFVIAGWLVARRRMRRQMRPGFLQGVSAGVLALVSVVLIAAIVTLSVHWRYGLPLPR
ncbi:MAG TPA: serine/threonine-protein kinase [Polyangiaceae bacterium]|nr:serine/threonine-protein kinase [Polyangiaceae bacterium]